MRTQLCGITLIFLMALGLMPGQASSHREAPLLAMDPTADHTDLYAFVSPDQPDTVTLIANFIPFQKPDGGPNFYSFDPNVVYEIHIDNNGDAVEDITYQWRFTTEVRTPATFLYNTGQVTTLDDPDLNVRQFYRLTRIDGPRRTGTVTELSGRLPTPVRSLRLYGRGLRSDCSPPAGDSVAACNGTGARARRPRGGTYSDFKYSTSSRFWLAERFSLK